MYYQNISSWQKQVSKSAETVHKKPNEDFESQVNSETLSIPAVYLTSCIFPVYFNFTSFINEIYYDYYQHYITNTTTTTTTITTTTNFSPTSTNTNKNNIPINNCNQNISNRKNTTLTITTTATKITTPNT